MDVDRVQKSGVRGQSRQFLSWLLTPDSSLLIPPYCWIITLESMIFPSIESV